MSGNAIASAQRAFAVSGANLFANAEGARASNRNRGFEPSRGRSLAALSVLVSGLACATTRTWTPVPDEPDSRQIASSVAGKNATLLLKPAGTIVAAGEIPAVAGKERLETQTVDMEVKEVDFAAVHGETADGPRSIALSEVGSISYVENRGATAALGAILGAVAAGAIGYAIIQHSCTGDSQYACPLVTGLSAGAGALVGAIVGALIGQRVTLLVQPAPAR